MEGVIAIFCGAIVIAFAILKGGALFKRQNRLVNQENLMWDQQQKDAALADLMREQAYIEISNLNDVREIERLQNDYLRLHLARKIKELEGKN